MNETVKESAAMEEGWAVKPWELLLPPVIPAVVGREVAVYFDNLIAGNASRYDFDVETPVGLHRNDGWVWLPDQAGDYPLTVEVYAEEGTRLARASTVVRVKPAEAEADASAASISVPLLRAALFIGDSTTAAGHYTAELLRLFSLNPSKRLVLIGTKGAKPNVHEGRGGWRVDQFAEHEESPFVFDGRFDFSRYMKENGLAPNDGWPALTHVGIHLGINDIFHAEDERFEQILTERMSMLESMIAGIRAYDGRIRIGMMTVIPPSRNQDSFAASYGSLQSRRRYKRKWAKWNRELLLRFVERSDVEIVPTHVVLDSTHNMPVASSPVNACNAATIVRQNDGVHPAVGGYQQMADMLYAWLI